MSPLRLAVVLIAAAAGLSTGAAAGPDVSRPLLTFVVAPADSDLIPLGLCATDLHGQTFRLSDPRQDAYESWSPDGRFLTFTRRTNDSYSDNHYEDMLMTDERGSIIRKLGSGRVSYAGPWWSPSGNSLAGMAFWGASSSLWVMNLDGSGGSTIFSSGFVSTPSWSPDGTRLLFSKWQSGETYVVDADGSNRRKLLDSSTDPVWSPDGRQFAYVALGADGRHTGLAVAQADGSDPRLLAEGDVAGPAWSPDGTTIAFTRQVETSVRVALIRPDGTNEHTIATGGGPVWSPDGDTIAFEKPGEPARVAAIRPDGTDERTIETGLPGTATLSPAWRRSAPLPRNRRPCVAKGTAGRDVLRGTKRGDVIFGGAGNDTINGAGGRDVLVGGPGRDRLLGGPGNDFFSARDARRDRLFGGPGWDRGDYDRLDRVVSVERPG